MREASATLRRKIYRHRGVKYKLPNAPLEFITSHLFKTYRFILRPGNSIIRILSCLSAKFPKVISKCLSQSTLLTRSSPSPGRTPQWQRSHHPKYPIKIRRWHQRILNKQNQKPSLRLKSCMRRELRRSMPNGRAAHE